MPAPSNTSFATATDLGSTLPQTVTQQVDSGGTTYTVWFKITPTTNALGVFGFGDLTTYRPTTTFWTDASTQVFGSPTNVPGQIATTAGTPVWIKVTPNGGNPSPANLTLALRAGPTDDLAAGMIAINDSSIGYPAVIMNGSTAEPVAFRHPFSAGEGTAVLRDSGIVAALDIDVDGVVIYNADFSVRATPTMPSAGYTDALGTNQIDTFWVGKSVGVANAFIVSFDQDGTFGTPLDLGANGIQSVTPRADNTEIFFPRTVLGVPTVMKITNPGGVVSSTGITSIAGYSFGANLMMLTDDTLLVPNEKAATDSVIRRYALNGSLLGSITLSGVQNAIEHLFADPSDPDHFWVWYQTSTHNVFIKIAVSSMTIVTTAGPWVKFIEGEYQDAESATPSAYFGADYSCKPWILRTGASDGGDVVRTSRRGIYVPTRGVGGAEGGGEGISFDHLDGRFIPVEPQHRTVYVSPGGEGGAAGDGSQPTIGRTLYVAARPRAIYVPPDAEGPTLFHIGQRTIEVPEGAEGYTHR